MKTPKFRLMVTSSLFCVFPLVPTVSGGATLAGTVNTAPSNSVNLTNDGTTNWAVWNYASANRGPTLAPSNGKSGGPSVATTAGYISGLTRVGSSGTVDVRGGNASVVQFSYTDGASPDSFGPGFSGMVFPFNLDAANQGVRLSVTGDPNQLYRVDVWASGLAGQGTLTASSNGVANVILQSQTYTATDSANGAKGATLFSFTFQPDSLADVLNLSYILTTDTPDDPAIDGNQNGNSHVGISAVTVSAIPEPSSLAFVAALGALGLMRRRRA